MSTRNTWFELKTESAVFDVHEDMLVGGDGPNMLIYCTLLHVERGNGYGEGRINEVGLSGIFYVGRKDFAELCKQYLARVEPSALALTSTPNARTIDVACRSCGAKCVTSDDAPGGVCHTCGTPLSKIRPVP